jgi:hypothetical protein
MKLFKSVTLLAWLWLPALPADSAGEATGESVECANLIYAGHESSVCFSEVFCPRSPARRASTRRASSSR